MVLPCFVFVYRSRQRYRDIPDDEEEETVSVSTPPTQPSTKTTSKPSKLVDLGAAATFGGSNTGTATTTQTTNQQQTSSLDEIFGDFSEAPATNNPPDLMSG